MLVTNDLTEKVAQEAIAKAVHAVVTYHPSPFRSMKRISRESHTSRVVLSMLHHGIAVYAPHTGLDGCPGGINDWLLSAFPTGTIAALKPAPIPRTLAHLPTAEETTFPSPVDCLAATPATAPCGDGRILTLTSPMTLADAVAAVKEHLALSSVQLAPSTAVLGDAPITPQSAMEAAGGLAVSTIAVCAGSGASMLQGVSADLLLTGEMSHHEVLQATAQGSSVILTNHSNSERGYLPILAQRLQAQWDCPGVELDVHVTAVDADPLVAV